MLKKFQSGWNHHLEGVSSHLYKLPCDIAGAIRGARDDLFSYLMGELRASKTAAMAATEVVTSLRTGAASLRERLKAAKMPKKEEEATVAQSCHRTQGIAGPDAMAASSFETFLEVHDESSQAMPIWPKTPSSASSKDGIAAEKVGPNTESSKSQGSKRYRFEQDIENSCSEGGWSIPWKSFATI